MIGAQRKKAFLNSDSDSLIGDRPRLPIYSFGPTRRTKEIHTGTRGIGN